MIDMSTWQELVVDVDELQLDPHNVRLELSDGVTEGDIVQDLFSNEGYRKPFSGSLLTGVSVPQ